MEVLFVRHGQPAWSVGGISQPDPDLTELGRTQAEQLADRVLAEGTLVTELIVTPAARSIQTGAPIAQALGIEPTMVPDLIEIKMPDWSYTPTETVEKAFRDAYERPPEEWWDGMPGGETFRNFHNRITTAVIDLLGQRKVVPHGGHVGGHLWEVSNPGETIVVVAHGGTNAVALGFLLGLDPTPWEWERFVLGHASVARIRTFPIGTSHIFGMTAFNDMEHLQREQRTR